MRRSSFLSASASLRGWSPLKAPSACSLRLRFTHTHTNASLQRASCRTGWHPTDGRTRCELLAKRHNMTILWLSLYTQIDWNKARNQCAAEDLYYPHPLIQDVLWWACYKLEPLLR